MKQLKWEPILIGSDDKQKALEANASFFRELARSKWTSCEFQEIYYSLCDEHGEDESEWLHNVCFEVLDFAGCMSQFNNSPTLIEMQVPFGIRRQCYELHTRFEHLFYTALDSNDFYYNLWSEEKQLSRERVPLSKVALAKALWRWYFRVLEPTSQRFLQIGSEHHVINHLK